MTVGFDSTCLQGIKTVRHGKQRVALKAGLSHWERTVFIVSPALIGSLASSDQTKTSWAPGGVTSMQPKASKAH
jgi:hypothetical protein